MNCYIYATAGTDTTKKTDNCHPSTTADENIKITCWQILGAESTWLDISKVSLFPGDEMGYVAINLAPQSWVWDYRNLVENWTSEISIDAHRTLNPLHDWSSRVHWLSHKTWEFLPSSTLVWDFEEIQALWCLWQSVWACGLLPWQGWAGHRGVQAFLIGPLVSRSMRRHKLVSDDSILMAS